MLLHSLDRPSHDLKVAVVTPSYARDAFLAQTYRYFKSQQGDFAARRWFVLDDSENRSQHAFFNDDDEVAYHWLAQRQTLGHKRNLLNDMAQEWGADIICSMDDDDWYGPEYLKDMTTILLASDRCFAGSGCDYYFDANSGKILFIPAVRDETSCNGVLCYKTKVLQWRRYDDSARMAEEGRFLLNEAILQHPDVKRIHMALAWKGNTVTKRNYVNTSRYHTDLTLDDFPMEEADRQFYRQLV